MTDLTREQFANLIGGYGFERFEEGAVQEFQAAVAPLVGTSVGGAQSGGGQTEGATGMPPEFYGVDVPARVYTSNPHGSNPSMAHVTDTIARPALEQTFPVPHAGGASRAAMDEVFEKLLKQYRVQTGGKLRLKKAQKEEAKNIFRGFVDMLFKNIRKVAKKTNLLKAMQVKKAAKKL